MCVCLQLDTFMPPMSLLTKIQLNVWNETNEKDGDGFDNGGSKEKRGELNDAEQDETEMTWKMILIWKQTEAHTNIMKDIDKNKKSPFHGECNTEPQLTFSMIFYDIECLRLLHSHT